MIAKQMNLEYVPVVILQWLSVANTTARTERHLRMIFVVIILAFSIASNAYGQCDLAPGPGLNLGPTDETRLHSTGEVKMAFLFVDFPDAPANETAQVLYDALMPFAQDWVSEVSYGRATLIVTPVYQWFRMPKTSGSYNFSREGFTFELHKGYIADAVAAADGAVDFSEFDGVYILASKDADVPFSPTWIPGPGFGIQIDGIELRHVVTLGGDTRLAIPVYHWHVIQHETGHLWGLPDLYLYTGADMQAAVGGWDNMGWIALGAHFTAWQKRKLGWLLGNEFTCVTGKSQVIGLSPLENAGGIRGLAIKTGLSTAIVAETRRPVGQDSRLCDQGLLVYAVDSQIANGEGPMVVQRAVSSVDPALINQCGPGYNATFSLTGGKPTVFEDDATGVSIEILGSMVDGGLTVRVTNPTPFTETGTEVMVFRQGAWLPFDFATGQPTNGVWTGRPSPSCIPLRMDYDGDGIDEFTQFCNGAWHFYNDNGSLLKSIWTGNVAGDVPVPADYDGDGTDDVVIFRGGAWLFFDFATGSHNATKSRWTGAPPHWLGGKPVPVPMDYDGDGSADFTVYSGGPWHFFNDNGAYVKGIWTGAVAGDIPVPGDYHGLNHDEVVVFRGGAWLFFDFGTGQFQAGNAVWTGRPAHWNGGTSMPAPLDYDGDGILDFTVYSGGPWHFFNDNGTYNKGIWTGGVPGDTALSAAPVIP